MTGEHRWSRRRSSRREFLQGLAAVAAVAATGGWVRWSARVPAAEWLASTPATSSARASAAVVGLEYLRARADIVTPEMLVAEVASRVPGLGNLAARGSITETRAAVAEAVERDFARLDVVRVRGWILSETEARVCGLVALATDPSLRRR